MRVHLLAPPNGQTTKAYSLDGFLMATIRFAKVLKMLGHQVFLYASEENEAPCDEFITVISKDEIRTLLKWDNDTPYQYAIYDAKSPLYQLANVRAADAIASRKQKKDIICQITGGAQEYVTSRNSDLLTVEYSIGYEGSYSNHRIYESHAWRHWTHGYFRQTMGVQGRFFDDVIPCGFEQEDFPVNLKPEPFVLYVGRFRHLKGIQIACQAAEKAGMPLKLIGHGPDVNLITYGENLGTLSYEDRNQWMSRAQVVITPTMYLEPFGCMTVEAQLCGTPVVTTDWGGFTETVEQNKTGFRCTYLGEFIEGLQNAKTLDRAYIAKRAREKYSLEAVAVQYDKYFKRLNTLFANGWNTVTPL